MTESHGGYANPSFTRRAHVYGGQDNTVLEIIEAVFAGVAPYADWRISDEVMPCLAAVAPRSVCAQYREAILILSPACSPKKV